MPRGGTRRRGMLKEAHGPSDESRDGALYDSHERAKRRPRRAKGPEVGKSALNLGHDGVTPKAFLGDWQVRSF